MFGFVTKFKSDVIAGFDSVHQRLVTLEAKVEALFNHTKVQAEAAAAPVTAAVEAEVSTVETKATAVEAVASDVAKTVEDTKGAA